MSKINRYTFLTRSTMNPAKIRSAATRRDARRIKRSTTRDVVIFDRQLNKVVR